MESFCFQTDLVFVKTLSEAALMAGVPGQMAGPAPGGTGLPLLWLVKPAPRTVQNATPPSKPATPSMSTYCVPSPGRNLGAT